MGLLAHWRLWVALGACLVCAGLGAAMLIALRLPPGTRTVARLGEEEASFFVGEGPYSVAVVDLDGDGPLDLVTSNLVAESITALSGGRPGHPAQRWDWPVGGMGMAVVAADLDGDGDQDAASAVRTRLFGRELPGIGHLVWLPTNTGTGPSLDPVHRLWLRGTPMHLASGDLDGDGADELAIALRENAVAIVEQNGSSQLRQRARLSIEDCAGLTDYGPDGIEIADVNGDGALDIALICYDTWSVHVALGDGHGGFGAERVVGRVPEDAVSAAIRARSHAKGRSPGTARGGLRKLVAADLDGDGVQDLLAVGDWGLTLFVPGASGEEARVIDTGIDGTNSLAVARLREDILGLDVLVLTGMERLGIYLPSAAFREPGVFEVDRFGPLPLTPEALALADLDGDLHLDLVVAGEHASQVQYFRGDGRGRFEPFPGSR